VVSAIVAKSYEKGVFTEEIDAMARNISLRQRAGNIERKWKRLYGDN